LFVLIDVEALTTEALPPRAAIIAGPLTSAVEDTVENGVSDVLASAQFQALWIEANRVAHQQILAILRGDSEVVQATGGEVSLNLLPVMNAVIGRLETSASGLFGKEINVPEISNGEVPAEARQKIEDAVGVDVPEDFGEIPVYQSDALSAAQDALGTLDDVMLAVIIATPLVVAAAILISGRRRRTIIQLLTGTLLGLVVVRRLVIWSQDQVVDIAREENRGAVRVAVDDLMSSFFSISAGVIIAGLILLAIVVVTGPYGWAVSLRRHARDATVSIWGAVTNASQGEATASWIRAHRDLLKLAGVAFAILVLLLFDLSWAAFLAIVAIVAGYELFVSRVGGSDPAPSVSEKPA
jgi:hypothetical protein